MREKEVEQKLVAAVKNMGGICPKFVSPGINGMPDRLVLLPNGLLAFIELKAPGKKPRAIQIKRHGMLRKLGFKVFVVNCIEQIPQVLKEIGGDA